MLKIKDNVDLKELEKFGLKERNYYDMSTGKLKEKYYILDSVFIRGDFIFIDANNREINRHIYDTLSEAINKSSSDIISPSVANKIENLLYDLIKADLVEKVDDE